MDEPLGALFGRHQARGRAMFDECSTTYGHLVLTPETFVKLSVAEQQLDDRFDDRPSGATERISMNVPQTMAIWF